MKKSRNKSSISEGKGSGWTDKKRNKKAVRLYDCQPKQKGRRVRLHEHDDDDDDALAMFGRPRQPVGSINSGKKERKKR